MSLACSRLSIRDLCRYLFQRVLTLTLYNCLECQDRLLSCLLIIAILRLLSLVEKTKCIVPNVVFFLFNYFTTVETTPSFKIYKMIEERLANNQTVAFWALHSRLPPFCFKTSLVCGKYSVQVYLSPADVPAYTQCNSFWALVKEFIVIA